MNALLCLVLVLNALLASGANLHCTACDGGLEAMAVTFYADCNIYAQTAATDCAACAEDIATACSATTTSCADTAQENGLGEPLAQCSTCYGALTATALTFWDTCDNYAVSIAQSCSACAKLITIQCSGANSCA